MYDCRSITLHTQDVHGVITYRINPLLPRTIYIVFNSYPMNDETFAERQPFDDSSSISDTESFSVPAGADAGAAGEEEGPGTAAIQAEELCQCRAVYEGSGNEKKEAIVSHVYWFESHGWFASVLI